MCLFKRRPNISKSDRAERGIIVTGTGKVTFPELDPQLVQTEEASDVTRVMNMFTNITWSSALKCISVYLLFLYLKKQ